LASVSHTRSFAKACSARSRAVGAAQHVPPVQRRFDREADFAAMAQLAASIAAVMRAIRLGGSQAVGGGGEQVSEQAHGHQLPEAPPPPLMPPPPDQPPPPPPKPPPPPAATNRRACRPSRRGARSARRAVPGQPDEEADAPADAAREQARRDQPRDPARHAPPTIPRTPAGRNEQDPRATCATMNAANNANSQLPPRPRDGALSRHRRGQRFAVDHLHQRRGRVDQPAAVIAGAELRHEVFLDHAVGDRVGIAPSSP
jgi:hypothetical protein